MQVYEKTPQYSTWSCEISVRFLHCLKCKRDVPTKLILDGVKTAIRLTVGLSNVSLPFGLRIWSLLPESISENAATYRVSELHALGFGPLPLLRSKSLDNGQIHSLCVFMDLHRSLWTEIKSICGPNKLGL